MATYIPNTVEERQEMLASIGKKSVEELLCPIPDNMRLHRALALPQGKTELEVKRQMEEMAKKNKLFGTVFRGVGAYKHFIPSVVGHLSSREEFVTAYTPYQAEISQGILQSIFEYQTMMCEVTGMDASNASIYDGATATAEAATMCRDRKRTKAVVCGSCHPNVIDTVKTYAWGLDSQVVVVPVKNGVTDMAALKAAMDDNVSCVIMQQPNFFGQLEDAAAIGVVAHEAGAKYIMNVNPMSLAVLKTPAEEGADIAVGDAQPFGLSVAFGGPYLGFITCKDAMTRKLPGRIVGETVDLDGKRAYVLTLQAREQHIRREKASSSVCSNQALCALTASIYLAAMGPQGLRDAAMQSMSKARYMAQELCSIPGVTLSLKGDYFNEFATKIPGDLSILLKALEEADILGGYPMWGELEGSLLWCVTELNSKEEIHRAVSIVKAFVEGKGM